MPKLKQTTERIRRISISLPLLLLASALATAAEETKELTPVEVVGTRTNRSLEMASPSISLYREEDIQERQWDTLTDVLASMPGTTLVQSGQEGSLASLFTRGTNSDHTSVLLNRRKLNPGFSGFYALGQISLAGVTQVEFHRGAASTLWGNEGMGGVINIRTNTFSAEDNPGIASVEAGSFSTLNAGVNQKFSRDQWRGNLALSRKNTENNLPNHELDQWTGQAYLERSWNDEWSSDLQVFSYHSEIGLPGNRKSPGYPQMQDFQRDQTWLISPGVSYQPDSRSQFRGFYSHSRNDLRGLTTSAFGQTFNDFRTRSDQLDFQWDFQFRESWLLSTGINYLNLDFLQTDLNQPAAAPPLTDDNWNSWSAFSQIQGRLGPAWSVSAGLRYDDYSDFDSPWTGKVTTAFQPGSGPWTFFGELATAYSIPQAFDVFGQFGNPNLNAEEMDSLEIGVKVQPKDGRWNASALLFFNDLHNLIDFTPQFTTENIGSAETRGLETAFSLNATESSTLWAQYTYLHAINRDSGARLARRPSHTLQAGFTTRAIANLVLGAEIKGVADREDIDGGTFQQVDAGDFWVARLTARYSFPQLPLTATLRIENLLDEDYDPIDGFAAPPLAAYAGLETRW